MQELKKSLAEIVTTKRQLASSKTIFCLKKKSFKIVSFKKKFLNIVIQPNLTNLT